MSGFELEITVFEVGSLVHSLEIYGPAIAFYPPRLAGKTHIHDSTRDGFQDLRRIGIHTATSPV